MSLYQDHIGENGKVTLSWHMVRFIFEQLAAEVFFVAYLINDELNADDPQMALIFWFLSSDDKWISRHLRWVFEGIEWLLQVNSIICHYCSGKMNE